MAKRKGRMPTIWKVDDELWRLIKPIIDADMPRQRTGRPPVDRRKVLNCIIHRMRSGCQWKRIAALFDAAAPRAGPSSRPGTSLRMARSAGTERPPAKSPGARGFFVSIRALAMSTAPIAWTSRI